MKNKPLVLIISLAILIVLSACGQTSGSEKPEASPTPSASPTAGSSAPAADAGSSSSAAADEILKNNPNAKIASISIHITNNLLALGITPVGSVVGGDVKDFLPHVKDRLAGAAKLGVVTDPDMEAILSLKPDVIFIDSVYSGKDRAKFEQIAPIIAIDMDAGTWRDHLQTIAGHVGHEAQAEAFIKNYDDKAAKVSKLIHSELGEGAKVMAIRSTAKELRVMGIKRPVGPIMFDDLALKPANGVEKIDKAFEVISQEVLPDFDADAIFVIISKGNEAMNNYTSLEKSALWSNLKAVKNRHVYVLDGQTWLDYSSIGQDFALDDAERLFKK
ncbi:ABC transporter substrate-binding protein [Cohnella faecalis]|uniref:Iron-hydroxamate ABC transporter substrate-binding protein n=1 Tax=Cohnella faecalis TaxID=2315694 RepID=A0A398CMN8_9BACL|nr:ABC transporter substrate-binding protein [Cohnella faecalis]RIE01167.1 iron-hydroxamate ABC transporter substrate-binding protein [Cohnella faecalis]